MSKAKHTPGPWTIGKGRFTVRTTDGKFIARTHIAGSLRELPEVEQEANASLISAAPELLQALRMVMNVMPAEPPAAGRLIGAERRHYDAIMAAKKAIRKAEGRA